MRSSQRLEAPPSTSLPQAPYGHRRIALPLPRVLGFARQDSELRPSRQLAFALRPLLGLALATTGLCPEPSPVSQLRRGRTRRAPHAAGEAGDLETLISALSSLVEVVKLLTPSEGRVHARLGHEALPSRDESGGAGGDGGADGKHREGRQARIGAAGATGAAMARSEVVIELVSTAGPGPSGLPAQILGDLGSLAFELAVVAAIVEAKGGELYLGAPRGDSRSFVVRLPVRRAAARTEGLPGSSGEGAVC
jgi:hypothetical protein